MKLENVSSCDIYEIENARRENLMNARQTIFEKPHIKISKLLNKTKCLSNKSKDKNKKHESSKISIQLENKQLDLIETQISSNLIELETNKNNFQIAESESYNYLEDLGNFNPSALYRSKKLETIFKPKSERKKYQPFYKTFSSLNYDFKPNHDFQYSIKPNNTRSNNFLLNPSIIDSEFFLDNNAVTEVEKIRNQLRDDYAQISHEYKSRSVSARKSANLKSFTSNKNTIDFGSTLQLKEKLRAIARKHQIKNFYLNPNSVPNSASQRHSEIKTISFKNSIFKQDEGEKTKLKSPLNFNEFYNHQNITQYGSESFANFNSQITCKPKIVGYTESKSHMTSFKSNDNPLAKLNLTFLRSSSINRPFVIDNSTQNNFRNPISINGRSYFLSNQINKPKIRFLNKTSSVRL